MMKQNKLSSTMRAAILLAVLAMLAACEKPILDDGSVDGGSPGEANVVLHFTQSEGSDFSAATRAATHADTPAATRAATDITDLCSRLNLAVFNADGTKVKTMAQKEGDASYGTVALSLAAGTYQLVVIAHNGDGSASPPPIRTSTRPSTTSSVLWPPPRASAAGASPPSAT